MIFRKTANDLASNPVELPLKPGYKMLRAVNVSGNNTFIKQDSSVFKSVYWRIHFFKTLGFSHNVVAWSDGNHGRSTM